MRFAGRKRTIPRWSECTAADRRVVGPYGSITGDAKQRADVPKAWLPPTKFHSKIWGVSHGHRPLRIEGEVSANTQASGAERSVSGAAARDGCVAAKIIPNGAINTGRSRGGRSARQHRAGRGRARPLPRGPNVSADGPPGRRPLRKHHRWCQAAGRCGRQSGGAVPGGGEAQRLLARVLASSMAFWRAPSPS